jgi:hypothetical protein
MRSRVSWPTYLLLGCAAVLGPVACNQPRVSDGTGKGATGPGPTANGRHEPAGAAVPCRPRIWFEDVAELSGVRFRHIDGATDMHYVAETMGSGVAWIDFDQDGYLDLFLVQGSAFPPDPKTMPRSPSSRLFRNLGDNTFLDVTEQVGLRHPGYGQGVAVGDYDNDGYPDLFVTCYGHCHLFHNEPGGPLGRRFRDVTREAGITVDGWCTSCAFGDLHGKGYLDLFVCRYLVMDLKNYPFCGDKTRDPPLRYTCGPKEFPGTSSVLFRNNGDGTFTDVSREAGLEREGKGLGVLIMDLDGDGRPDVFVGNDEVLNHHYRNLGNGKLESVGLFSGTAASGTGKPVGSMGVDADDVTGDGLPDLFITTYLHEGTLLLRNQGNNIFSDMSRQAGMYQDSWNLVGWGTGFFDPDHDGNLDLFVVNGHVYRNAPNTAEKTEEGRPLSFQQPAQLFRGNGQGFFTEISAEAGPYFRRPHVGRGVALGDYDNDGLMDLAVNHCGEPASLLHNETVTPYHWVRLVLEGSRHRTPGGSNRDAIGGRVTLKVGGRTVVRHVKGGGSYYSSSDRRLLIGLGTATRVEEVEVRWPNAAATVQRFGPLETGKSYKLVEGMSAPEAALCPPLRKR